MLISLIVPKIVSTWVQTKMDHRTNIVTKDKKKVLGLSNPLQPSNISMFN